MLDIYKEKAIRAIVSSAVKAYANGFSTRHLAELNNENGVINMKIHNVFIAALGSEIQYYSALARSLDSSLGNMLENMAICIAKLNYDVNQHVEGVLYKEQTDYIAELLEQYKRSTDRRVPKVTDYRGITNLKGSVQTKRHESDYYLVDNETNMHYLINLGIDKYYKKDRILFDKEKLLEQYCVLANRFGEDSVKILYADAYDYYGDSKLSMYSATYKYFSIEELCDNRDFWNMVCKSERGYDIVIDEYKKNVNILFECYPFKELSYMLSKNV